MAQETKEVTDSVSISKMFETLYKQFPIFIIIDGKPKQVKIIAVKNQNVLIQSPDENPNPVERSLFLTNAGNLLHFKFKVNAKDPRGIELLIPVLLSIKTATRTTNRYQASKIPLYITNTIGQSMVTHDLSGDTIKVESITKPYIQKLKSKFSEVEIHIQERMDARARLMTDTGKHIFVPDTKNQDSVTDAFIPFGEYIHIMKLGKGSNKYNSEICVPIKYKDFVLFGYIQILHLEKMNVNDYNLVLQVASKISKDFMESGIFNDSKFKATIMDISSNGFSVSHPQSKNFGKIFSIGGTIIFDMFEEENNLGTFRAVVRNIKPLEKLFRIGCQFFHASEENTIIEELMKKYFTEGQEKENTNSTEDKQNTKTGITDPKIKADLTQPVKD